MPGPLTQSPLSGAFWRQMGSGLRDTVFAPIARDVMAGHQSLRQNYPLPYEVAQAALPPVGIAAAGMDYAEAARNNDSQDMVRAALSAIPVAGRSFPTTRDAAVYSARASPMRCPRRVVKRVIASLSIRFTRASPRCVPTGGDRQTPPRHRSFGI